MYTVTGTNFSYTWDRYLFYSLLNNFATFVKLLSNLLPFFWVETLELKPHFTLGNPF